MPLPSRRRSSASIARRSTTPGGRSGLLARTWRSRRSSPAGARPARSSTRRARWTPDLVVVGHRGMGEWESRLLGSVSAEVVDHAPCPVLVVRDDQLGPVVLAVDGSAHAQAAEAVAGWPLFAGLPVTVVTVVDGGFPYAAAVAPPLYAETVTAYATALEAERRARAADGEAAVARLRSDGATAEADVRTGDPAHEIVACARERAASVIVIGSRGQTGRAPPRAGQRGARCPAPGAVFGADRARWRPLRSRSGRRSGGRTGSGRRLRLIASPGAPAGPSRGGPRRRVRYARRLMTWRRRATSRLAAVAVVVFVAACSPADPSPSGPAVSATPATAASPGRVRARAPPRHHPPPRGLRSSLPAGATAAAASCVPRSRCRATTTTRPPATSTCR